MTKEELYQWVLDQQKLGISLIVWCEKAGLTGSTLTNFTAKRRRGEDAGLKGDTIYKLQSALPKLMDEMGIQQKNDILKQKKEETAAPNFNNYTELWNLYKAAPPDIQNDFDVLHADYIKKKAASPDKCLDRQTNYGTGNS